mmetsp:Transcript_57820/g.133534  ORF Transcript_57820/g.133534 Transcript_57820/m.133534 type:complete len:647 (-) Transcript_57820:121-2061(-)
MAVARQRSRVAVDLEEASPVFDSTQPQVPLQSHLVSVGSFTVIASMICFIAAGVVGISVTAGGSFSKGIALSVLVLLVLRVGVVAAGLALGSPGAETSAAEMGQRAMREAYALKRQWLFLWCATVTLLGAVFTLTRNLAYSFHKPLLAYTFGTVGMASLVHPGIHTRDYVSLQVDNTTLLGVAVPASHGDRVPAPVTQGWTAEQWRGRIRGSHTHFFVLPAREEVVGSRPRPLRVGDWVELMGGNRLPLGCRPSDGLGWTGPRNRLYVDGKRKGEPVRAGGCVRLASGHGGRAVTVDQSGRVGCFAGPDNACPLRMSNMQASPPVALGWNGKEVPLESVLDKQAVRQLFSGDAEVRLAMPFEANSSGRVVWPVNAEPPRLQDAVFDIIPALDWAAGISEPLQFWIGGQVSLLVGVACVLWPLPLGRSPLGWWPVCLNILCRVGRVLVVAFLLRGATFLATALPGARGYCSPTWVGGLEDFWHPPDPAEGWNAWQDWSLGGANCGDNLPSGHTINAMVTVMVVQSYFFGICNPGGAGSRILCGLMWALYLAAVAGVFALCSFQFFLIVASRNHYSADVLVSVYMTPLVYIFDSYIVWPRDVEPPEDATWWWLLTDVFGYLPLPEMVVDWLRVTVGGYMRPQCRKLAE